MARGPVPLLALAVLSALWGFGAYQWLWLSEASALVLLLTFVWGLAQLVVAVGMLAGTTVAATEAAMTAAPRLGVRDLARFGLTQFVRCLLMATGGIVLVRVLSELFDWVNSRALEVASFLRLHLETAVHPVTIEQVFEAIEAVIWVIVGGFLVSFLIILLRAGWRAAWGQAGRTLANCCWRTPFLTCLLTALVFGGLSYALATWRPEVTPGFWDYSQFVVRTGIALLLLVAGWLFLLLSLARSATASQETSAAPLPSL